MKAVCGRQDGDTDTRIRGEKNYKTYFFFGRISDYCLSLISAHSACVTIQIGLAHYNENGCKSVEGYIPGVKRH